MRQGFTLIEVVIVIAIIGIMTAFMVVSLSNQRRIRNLDLASQEIAAALRTAQNYALTGRSINAAENNCSFGVQMVAGATYTLVHSVGAGCATSAIGGDYSLRGGVSFAAAQTVNFLLPRGEVGAKSTIRLTNGALSRYVCVNTNGRIFENGTNTCP